MRAAASAQPKRDLDAQEAFKKNFASLVAEALPLHAAGKPIEIWFQDEALVGQQGTLRYIWAERGSRPAVVRDDRHDSAWLFGAICPERAIGAAVVMPCVSSEVMSVHLAEIAKAVDPNAHGVLICDGAGWHQSGERLTVPHNVTLLRLPLYAPELNPVENVWEYRRGNYLGHTFWDTYEQIVEACCTAWNALVNDAERVTSVTTRQWARVTS